jgi:hypothetical protein
MQSIPAMPKILKFLTASALALASLLTGANAQVIFSNNFAGDNTGLGLPWVNDGGPQFAKDGAIVCSAPETAASSIHLGDYLYTGTGAKFKVTMSFDLTTRTGKSWVGLGLSSGGSGIWDLAATSQNATGETLAGWTPLSGGAATTPGTANVTLSILVDNTGPDTVLKYYRNDMVTPYATYIGTGITTYTYAGLIGNGQNQSDPFEAGTVAAIIKRFSIDYVPDDSPNLGLRFAGSGSGKFSLSWWGHSGCNYFIQRSSDLAGEWIYLTSAASGFPVLETGANLVIRRELNDSAPKGFYRLQLDADQNGIPDSWELTYTGTTGNNPSAPSAAGDGYSLLQEFQLGRNPNDYYQGVAPFVSILAGNNQVGSSGYFLPSPLQIKVVDGSGVPLVNAPVAFTAANVGGGVSLTDSGTGQGSLIVRTDSSGQAQVYFKGPPTLSGSGEVTVTAGTGAPVFFTGLFIPDPTPTVSEELLQRANFSFENVDNGGFPTGWEVRENSQIQGMSSLILPADPATASASFITDASTARSGIRSALINGDPGTRCLIMGESFPLVPIRNYLNTSVLHFELKGWIKGQNVTGNPMVALEFLSSGDPKWGLSGTSAISGSTGTYDWTQFTGAYSSTTERFARIACRAPGSTGKVWFDDFSLTINGIDAFELLAKVREWRDGTTHNGRLQASLPEAVIWTEDPAQKVLSWSRPPDGNPSAGIELTAAKGEYESIQIAFKPLRDLEGITVSFSNLQGAGALVLGKENLQAREVVLVNRPQRLDFIEPAGLVPDPLLERASYNFTQGGGSRSLWLTVQVPRDTPAGEYTGTITLGGAVNAAIPLKIKVRSFALPELTRFNLNAHLLPRCIALYDTRPWLQVMQDYLPDLAAHRSRTTNLGIFPIPVVSGGTVTLDPASLAESDATIAYAKSLGFHTFTTANSPFSVWGMSDPALLWKNAPWDALTFDTGIRTDSPEFPALYSNYLAQTAAHYQQTGALANVLQYIVDEPQLWASSAQKLEINDLYFRAQQAGFKTLHTTFPSADYSSVDTWCRYGPSASAQTQATGQKVEWYQNDLYTINRTTLNARLIPWFTWRYQLDGYLIWSVNYWAEGNPWNQVRLDGDGYLLYPNPNGVGKPCSSIRWEMFREGIEDYDYFSILKQRADAVLANPNASATRRSKAQAALNLLTEISALMPENENSPTYGENPATYSELRGRIGTSIEDLDELFANPSFNGGNTASWTVDGTATVNTTANFGITTAPGGGDYVLKIGGQDGWVTTIATDNIEADTDYTLSYDIYLDPSNLTWDGRTRAYFIAGGEVLWDKLSQFYTTPDISNPNGDYLKGGQWFHVSRTLTAAEVASYYNPGPNFDYPNPAVSLIGRNLAVAFSVNGGSATTTYYISNVSLKTAFPTK